MNHNNQEKRFDAQLELLMNRPLVTASLQRIDALKLQIQTCLDADRPLDRFPLLEKLNAEFDRLKKIVAFYVPLEDSTRVTPGCEFARGVKS
jgi:hypothetical protein